MKTILTASILVLLFNISYGQGGYMPKPISGFPIVGGKTMDMNVTWKAIDVSKFDAIEGTPFFTTDYVQSYIRLKTGEQFSNVWTRFNTYNNEVMLEVKEGELLALQNIDSIAFTKANPEEATKQVSLKTGFPSIDKNNETTFYEVIGTNGDVALLKYYKTSLEKVKKMGMPDKDAFVHTTSYYIYNASSKEMILVKLNKKSILSKLTKYPEAESKAKEMGVDFRKESALASFFKNI